MARTLVMAGAAGLRHSPMCVKPRDQCLSAQASHVQLSWHSLIVSQNFMKTWGNVEDDIRGGGAGAQVLCMCSGGLRSWLNGILLLPAAFLSISRRSDVRWSPHSPPPTSSRTITYALRT